MWQHREHFKRGEWVPVSWSVRAGPRLMCRGCDASGFSNAREAHPVLLTFRENLPHTWTHTHQTHTHTDTNAHAHARTHTHTPSENCSDSGFPHNASDTTKSVGKQIKRWEFVDFLGWVDRCLLQQAYNISNFANRIRKKTEQSVKREKL